MSWVRLRTARRQDLRQRLERRPAGGAAEMAQAILNQSRRAGQPLPRVLVLWVPLAEGRVPVRWVPCLRVLVL
jgi:hypothetical protein